MYALFFIVFLVILPHIYSFSFTDSGEFPKFIAFVSFVLIYFLFNNTGKLIKNIPFHLQIPISLPAIFFYLYTLFSLISIVFSQDKIVSIVGIKDRPYDNIFFSLFTLLMLFLWEKKKIGWKNLLLISNLGLLLELFPFFVHRYPNLNYLLQLRSVGNHGNTIIFGFYLACFFLINLTLVFVQKKTMNKIFSAFLLCILAFLLYKNASRGVQITFVSALLFYIYVYFKHFKKKILYIKTLIVPLLIVLLLIILGNKRFSNIQNDPTAQLRQEEIQVGLHIIKDHPIFGVGPGTLTYTFLPYRTEMFNYIRNEAIFRVSHIRNQYVTIAATSGIPTLFLFIIFSIILIKTSLKRIKSGEDILFLSLFVFISLFNLFSHWSMTSYPLYLLLTVILINNLNKSYAIQLSAKIIFFATVLSSLIIGIILLSWAKSNMNFTTAQKTSSAQTTISLLKNSIQTFPYDGDYYHLLATALTENNQYNESERILQRGIFFHPLEPLYYDELGRIAFRKYLKSGDLNYLSNAEKYSLSSLKLDPTNLFFIDNLGEVYLSQKNLEKAQDLFAQEIRQQPQNTIAMLHLGEALEQKGETKEAKKIYQKVLSIDPNQWIAKEKLKKLP